MKELIYTSIKEFCAGDVEYMLTVLEELTEMAENELTEETNRKEVK